MRLSWLGIPVGIINILLLWLVISYSEKIIQILNDLWRALS